MMDKENALQRILEKSVDGKTIFGTAFALKRNSFTWQSAAGNLSVHQPYFIASTTKLFTTALVLQLRAEGQLRLDDRVNTYIDSGLLRGLHVFKGRDYAPELTVHHLLAHTSGLPDYFQNKGANGKSLEAEIMAGYDQHWTFEQALERTRTMKPLFAPGTPGKAHYSDTNFQLLGKIIATITGLSFAENCVARIVRPLGLQHTYLYQDAQDTTPQPLFYKRNELHIPQAMTSFGADGGMVSTAPEMLAFIEAFFTGHLFPKEFLKGLEQWNPIFFPLRSGIGIHLFQLPWIMNPTGAVPAFIGHSGLSGALAFYCPREHIFVAGTVNQVAHPDASFRVMIRLIRQVQHA
jgi:CubicO group peptidase (beta-lactamase class C family)